MYIKDSIYVLVQLSYLVERTLESCATKYLIRVKATMIFTFRILLHMLFEELKYSECTLAYFLSHYTILHFPQVATQTWMKRNYL